METSTGATLTIAAVVFLAAVPARAQSAITGTAEWTVADSKTVSNTQASADRSLWQNYAVGFSSSLFDPRVVSYDTEVLFRTSRLKASGSNQADRQGQQQDIGYKLGTSLFQASAFPVFVQASRVFTGTSGDLGPSNPVRAAIGVPAGGGTPSFDTENRLVSLGGQLNFTNLPRVDVGYRQGTSIVSGDSYRSTQHDNDLSASVTKDTNRFRQSLRFQQSSFENVLSQTFSQRLSNLDYDFSALVGLHTRITAHGGRRTIQARADLPVPAADAAPYTPPPSVDGRAGSEYVSAGLTYEPTVRFVARLNGTVDRQTATAAMTNAQLAAGSVHYEIVRGLAVTGTGTSGDRGQLLGDQLVRVKTLSGVAGATYQAGVHWLQGSVGATRGLGTSVTPEGRQGANESWSREANLSSTIRWVSLGTGYERVSNRDEILDYGNYESQRLRASIKMDVKRVTV